MSNTLQDIGRHLTLAIKPLDDALRDNTKFRQLIYRLGWNVNAVPPAYLTVADKVSQAVEKLNAMLSSGTDPQLQDIIQLVEKVKDAYDAINSISQAPPEITDPASFIEEITERLFELLLTDYLAAETPGAYGILVSLQIIQQVNVNATADRPAFMYKKIQWDQIPEIIKNPSLIIQRIYGWNTDKLMFDNIIGDLYQILFAVRLPIYITQMSDDLQRRFYNLSEDAYLPLRKMLKIPYYDVEIAGSFYELAFALLELPADGASKPGLILQPIFPRNLSTEIALSDTTTLKFIADTNVLDTFGLLIRPDGISVRFPNSAGTTITASAGIRFTYAPPVAKTILGDSSATHLALSGIDAGLSINSVNDTFEVVLDAELNGLALVLQASEGDSFLSSLLGDNPQSLNLPLGFEWSSISGISFKGSSGFVVELYPHLQLGPVNIDALQVRLYAPLSSSDPEIKLEIGADISAVLGPLQLTINGIGFELNATFNGGNYGPFELSTGFKPPTGVGISIDTAGLSGGGFLSFDPDKGEYFGAIELTFQDLISLKAVGIINTKMPDGSKGFAMLILITAEFTPIQLGFGFTLSGVGGLLGVNRSTNIAALKSGVKTGAVNNILFPPDVVANITTIISDLTTIFPVTQDHFLIAPMAKINWGTPILISLEMGIIIDIPSPQLVILGVLKCILPDEKTAVLSLQVNFAGGIDFNQGLIWFDASLFDSKILTFTLTGDMALRIGWKNPQFILSVGGFHPAFKEVPSDLTGMKRLSLSLLSGDNPRINAQIYFAVTSNTVQSGAKVELYAEACGFNIYGFLGYDLLVQFSPFNFIADIYAGLALRAGTSEIAGISVHCTLSGPTPWHVKGDASFSILFFSISIGFNVTWGENAPSQPVETADVLQLMEDALNDDRNWKAAVPANTSMSVTLKKIELEDDQVIVHPFGVLSASQKVVPLGITLDKFGNKIPLADKNFKLTYSAGASTNVQEEFAIANFQKLSDSDKLSRPSFSEMNSGLSFSATDSSLTGFSINKDVDYEFSYAGRKLPAGILSTHKMFTGMFDVLEKGNIIYKNTFAATNKISTNGPAEVINNKPGFAVVNTDTLELHASGYSADTEAGAYEMYTSLLKASPSLKGKIQVVSSLELN